MFILMQLLPIPQRGFCTINIWTLILILLFNYFVLYVEGHCFFVQLCILLSSVMYMYISKFVNVLLLIKCYSFITNVATLNLLLFFLRSLRGNCNGQCGHFSRHLWIWLLKFLPQYLLPKSFQMYVSCILQLNWPCD